MRAVDIPQADSLSRIRELVQAVQFGAVDSARLQKVMSLHPRHVGYHLHAARVLNWVVKGDDGIEVTELGVRLIATAPGSQEERGIYRESISASEYLQAISPNLLDDAEPEQDLLSLRIQEVAGIAPATARRRASTLLRWRTQSVPTKVRRFTIEGASDDEEANRQSMQVHAIHVERYGLLGNVRAELGDAPVLVGENGAGKSTLLDVLRFVGDALNEGVSAALSRRGDRFEDVVWYGEGDHFRFAIEFTIPKVARYDLARARYELEIGRLEDGGIGVSRESLYLAPREAPKTEAFQGSTPRGWRKVLGMGHTGQARYGSEHPTSRKTTTAPVGNDRLGLSQLPDDPERFPAARRLRNLLLEGVKVMNVSVVDVAAPVAIDAPAELSTTGHGVPALVRHLETGPKDRYQEWLSHVREAVTGAEKIRTEERDGQLHTVVEIQGGVSIPLRRLSSGMLRVIGLSLLPYQDVRDAVFVLDSPETGIHPASVEPLVQALSKDSANQLITTTYSRAWISATPSTNLMCFARDAGAIRVQRGIDLQLDEGDAGLDTPAFFEAGLL